MQSRGLRTSEFHKYKIEHISCPSTQAGQCLCFRGLNQNISLVLNIHTCFFGANRNPEDKFSRGDDPIHIYI